MGGTLGWQHHPGPMVPRRVKSPHNSVGAPSSSRCLPSFSPLIRKKTVQILADNFLTMFYINRQGGAQSYLRCTEAVHLWQWCIFNNIYIPRHPTYLENRMPQQTTSAGTSHGCTSEELDPQILQTIFRQWGFPSKTFSPQPIMPNAHNTAPEWDWDTTHTEMPSSSNGESRSCMPSPRSPCCRVLHKIREDKSRVILIAPTWPRHPSTE